MKLDQKSSFLFLYNKHERWYFVRGFEKCKQIMKTTSVDRDVEFCRSIKWIGSLGIMIGLFISLASVSRTDRVSYILTGGLVSLVSWYVMALITNPLPWKKHFSSSLWILFFGISQVPFIPYILGRESKTPMRWLLVGTSVVLVLHIVSTLITGLMARLGARLRSGRVQG
jgi:hypothetical protein